MGHYVKGLSSMVSGDFKGGVEILKKAVDVAVDPLYTQFPAFMLGWCQFECGNIEMAEETTLSVIEFCEKFGYPQLGTPAVALMGGIKAQQGHLSQGFKMIEDSKARYMAAGRRMLVASSGYTKGKFFLEMLKTKGDVGIGAVARNIGFILKNAAVADRRGIENLLEAIEIIDDCGAWAFKGPSYLLLGQICAFKQKTDQAHEYYKKAIEVFEKCKAGSYLSLVEDELKNLD